MLSYFFVPGNKLNKIDNIVKSDVDLIIIDLEDAVKESERIEIIENLLQNKDYNIHYIRLPIHKGDKIDLEVLKILIKAGYTNFVLPKIKSIQEYAVISSELLKYNLNLILLVETVKFLMELQSTLQQYPKNIVGLSLGSHDLIKEIGAQHTLENLNYARTKLLYLAKMNRLVAIDIASMELFNENSFLEEVKDGVAKGFEAKLLIHPWQLSIFKKGIGYTDKDRQWAEKVLSELKLVGREEEFNPIVIDGQIIERPHLSLAKKILKHYENK